MSSSLAFMTDVDDALSDFVLAGLDQVEQRLRDVVSTEDLLARTTSRHLMDAGGKRIRPVLVLIASCLGRGADELGVSHGAPSVDPRVIDAAVLVELTHLATLYHDDVMDEASTRRGARTAHTLWGNSVAILTGDFLFSRASALSAGLGPDTVRLHARTFERLCLGQLHETVGPRSDEDAFAHYLGVLADKTASLIATAGELGAGLSEAPPIASDVMRRFGEEVGVAFQLADDVIDLRGDAASSGKVPGTDLREGVSTMPTLLVRRRAAQGDDSAATRELLAVLDSDLTEDAALARAVAMLREDPAVAETEAMASRTAERAIALLSELPAGPVTAALESFASSLVHRSA